MRAAVEANVRWAMHQLLETPEGKYLVELMIEGPDQAALRQLTMDLMAHNPFELARFLGVTESRVSQLRSEALLMLKEGIEAQYNGPVQGPEQGTGRVAKRKANYAVAISDASEWRNRLVGSTQA